MYERAFLLFVKKRDTGELINLDFKLLGSYQNITIDVQKINIMSVTYRI